jgi:hypothetical protein
VFLLPVALYVLGWNENNFVCERNRIFVAEDKAEIIGCDDVATLTAGELYFFSCPIQKSSLKTFTPSDFTKVSGDIGVPAMTTITAQMSAEMLLCQESCRTEKKKNSAGQNVKKTVCDYTLDWSSTYSSGTDFKSMSTARQHCGGSYNGNPPEPNDDLLGFQHTRHSPAPVKVGDSSKGYKLNAVLIQRLYANVDVSLDNSSITNAYTGTQVKSTVPTSAFTYSAESLQVSGDYLKSCSSDVLGCIRIKYMQSDSTSPSVIAAIDPDGMTKPYNMPGAWGCPGKPWQAIDGKSMSKADVIKALRDSNNAQVWIIRIVGLLCCWFAVYLCFSPFLYAVDCIGDVVNWCPCGGYLEDALEGIATAIACAISCPIGCSCGLFVISLVWLFMRPLYGALMMAVCVCCCAGAVAIRGAYTKPPSKRQKMRDMEYGE